MITISHRATEEVSVRFNMMLALLAFNSPDKSDSNSILCRVLDGRELKDVCPIDDAILTPDEHIHYAHLQNPHQRALAYRTRAELRRMLGREIGEPPQFVPLECDEHGKPRCLHPLAAGLDFSVSHSEECSLIALGEADGIGVDVERIIDEEPSDELLEVVFNQEELDQWLALPDLLHRRAFTEAWTVKEATLKATGAGLDGSPHEINIRFTIDGHAEPDFGKSNWMFQRVNFCPHHAASCVVILPLLENRGHGLAA